MFKIMGNLFFGAENATILFFGLFPVVCEECVYLLLDSEEDLLHLLAYPGSTFT